MRLATARSGLDKQDLPQLERENLSAAMPGAIAALRFRPAVEGGKHKPLPPGADSEYAGGEFLGG